MREVLWLISINIYFNCWLTKAIVFNTKTALDWEKKGDKGYAQKMRKAKRILVAGKMKRILQAQEAHEKQQE